MTAAIKIAGAILVPQVIDFGDSWTAELRVPRYVLKGNVRRAWNQFVQSEGSGGPGCAFACKPHIRRDGDDVVLSQSGGLDI
jgi:hypothetical protein